MTLNKTCYDVGLSSLVAAAYQSAAGYAYFTFPQNCENVAGQLEIGIISANSSLRTFVDHSIDGGASGDWKEIGEFPALAASSAVATLLSTTALLPYGRIRHSLENSAATAAGVKDIVGRVLTELK